jgi:4-coumarate--CoA ligase (photoactive yellow protein activation family)
VPQDPHRPDWWRAPWALERFIADLINAEARSMRPGGPWPRHVDPATLSDTVVGEGGLGFDSLERLGLAAALSEALHMHRGGLGDTLMRAETLEGWREAAAAALGRFGDLLTVRSSGSTGRRRSHVHPLAALQDEAEFWRDRLPDRLRIRSAVASHHIYGFLFSQLLPVRLGTPVDDLRPLSPGAVLGTLRPGDLVVGHPLFWDALLRVAPAGLPVDVVGVTSGAMCPDATVTGLLDAGIARLVDAYGSSETAGIGWREGIGPHHLLPWWERAAETLRHRSTDRLVEPPDRLIWEDGQRFQIGERIDGAVMVGGIIVEPDRVRDVLRAHPGVADAAVRLMSPRDGGRLKAFLVPREGHSDSLKAEVSAYVDEVLSAPERPRAYRIGPALPRTATGKPIDWEM